ncbi:uncharacterized protein LOC127251038 [Andrographis paniculata]|uniref:uncharacterized protein LOC127251038 n=1 Tax=Andrographis paniculata TaxID=175694 RepID=UPI0021E8D017|nr:uncharacterized protein LOC127251038 [Andrographis paniculata]
MSQFCISKCANDPIRATYVNLYKWPGSDAEFMRSAAVHGGGARLHSRVVDSLSCRQMYLRSYTFSRKEETVPERTINCFRKVRERVAAAGGDERNGKVRRRRRRRRRRRVVVGRMKEISRAALRGVFRRLLFCTATVDVVDPPV